MDISIEKTQDEMRENPFIIHQPGYGAATIYAVIVLIYANNALLGYNDIMFQLLCLGYLSLLLGSFAKIWQLNKDYALSLNSTKENNVFILNFSNTEFSYGYKNRLRVVVPYNEIIDFKVKRDVLIVEIASKLYTLDLKMFKDSEKDELIKRWSELDTVINNRKKKKFVPLL